MLIGCKLLPFPLFPFNLAELMLTTSPFIFLCFLHDRQAKETLGFVVPAILAFLYHTPNEFLLTIVRFDERCGTPRF